MVEKFVELIEDDMKYVNYIGMLLILVATVFVGCNKSGREMNGKVRLHGELVEMSPEYTGELSSRLNAMSKLIQTCPRESRDRCSELREWICSREVLKEREYGVEQLECSILATETRSLPVADRERAINAMFDLMMTDVLNGLNSLGASQSRKWRCRFRFLRRVLAEMQHVKEDFGRAGNSEIDKRRFMRLIEFMGANYNMWAKWMERDLVTCWAEKIAPNEYRKICGEFEELLGRPLKTAADFK